MDIVEFLEKVMNYRLLEYQKKLIRIIEKNPDNYSIKLFPLSRNNQVRVMSVKKTKHKGNSAEFIFTDELEHENKKEENDG